LATIFAYTTFIIALAFHNGLEDHNDDGYGNIGNDMPTSDRNLVSFGPVIPEIMRLVVGQICNKNWSRCSHLAEGVEFCVQWYFDML